MTGLDALNRIKPKIEDRFLEHDVDVDIIERELKRLNNFVDFDKPKMVIRVDEVVRDLVSGKNLISPYYRCPRCDHIVDNHFCSDCGQRLAFEESELT